MALDEDERSRIAPYVSSLTADVFALSGLPEEVIAVLFAYYSRSRDDLRTNLARLLMDQDLDVTDTPRHAFGLASEKARTFHEKWVVGYGHASVAEHAVVHLAVENISIIASKAIEDLRLASYTEKSTRYVVFDQSSFVDLPELPEATRERYQDACRRLFSTYLTLIPKVSEALRTRTPRAEGTSEASYNAVIRAQACDLLRGLLPASTRTNLGITANARVLEMLLSKLLSSPLAEVRRIGTEMRTAALSVAPTLVKYAATSEHRQLLPETVAGSLRRVYTPPDEGLNATMVVSQPVRLVRHDKDALERIALALSYEASQPGLHAFAVMEALRNTSQTDLASVVASSCARRGPYEAPPRGFEASTMTFELMLDFGAWRDLQRHRMLTPAVQRLSCRLGFETPIELGELGCGETFHLALLNAQEAWEFLEKDHPLEAQYAVPLGYRIRALWTLNLRELFHIIELRSAKQGHASYRRIAQGLYRTAISVHPWLKDLIRVDLNDYALARG
ncbi:FAD-dependent thymidylate synthase [Chondromyces apiculatus]|uniref:Thymidylate synthase thyX n=1 Tax=Chondromyces apiculatus DSM 436 TaxID=1192034 RepID=A0A017T3Z0_9BACT|nr:FAD-dependent thymidylate synthase [Chondromyces apiculatus]EYF03958.1 Thymidylate synthase thyX [Chondromyces apiculatus DSM 436]